MNLLISDIFLLTITLIALIFASITDIKKREVPNWLSFSLMVIALAIRAFAALTTSQHHYFYYALIALVLFFLLSSILYYTKFFAGGDAKLLIALAIIFATTPSYLPETELTKTIDIFSKPFLLSFLINVFAIGSIYSFIFIIFFAIKNKKKFSKEFEKVFNRTKTLRISFLALAFISLMVSFFFNIFFFIFALTLIFPYIYIITKATENISMIKKVSAYELTEGDWLVEKIKLKNKIIKPSVHGLSLEEIKLLKKSNKKVLIKYGIPFVPVFLISLICTILLGDLFILVIKGLFF
ncbi:MAG: prepilin peptidase [Candidatus Pacearchaeota archaeon]|nr:prepilin peptidase [Candidatus Pacearchaeota archaeon]